MSNKGRSTTGGPAVPYYRMSDHIEAAKYLRLTVSRYIADRASLKEVEEAMAMLRAAVPVASERGHRESARCGVEGCQAESNHEGLHVFGRRKR